MTKLIQEYEKDIYCKKVSLISTCSIVYSTEGIQDVYNHNQRASYDYVVQYLYFTNITELLYTYEYTEGGGGTICSRMLHFHKKIMCCK